MNAGLIVFWAGALNLSEVAHFVPTHELSHFYILDTSIFLCKKYNFYLNHIYLVELKCKNKKIDIYRKLKKTIYIYIFKLKCKTKYS